MEQQTQNTTPQSQPSTEPLVQKQNKNFLLIGFLLVIAVGAIAFYFGRSTAQTAVSPQQQTVTSIPTSFPTQSTITVTLAPSIADTSSLKEYKNNTYSYSFLYPQDLNIKESNASSVLLSSKPIEGFPSDEINYYVSVRDSSSSQGFDALFNASAGADVPEAHHAVSVIVKKMENTQIANLPAVTYFKDGISSPEPKGRGPIGYSYNTWIKVNANRYISIGTSSFDKEELEKQKVVYDKIIQSFTIETQ